MGTSLLVISSMAAFAAFLAIFAALSTAMPMNEKCCKTKTVGGIMYIFMDQMVDPEAYKCINGCVYMPESGSSKKFCFAKGDLEVECNDSDMRPTGGMPGMSPMPPMQTTGGMPGMSPTGGMPGMSPTDGMPGMSPTGGMPGMSPTGGMPGMSPTDGMPGMSTMDGGMKPTGGVIGGEEGTTETKRFTPIVTCPAETTSVIVEDVNKDGGEFKYTCKNGGDNVEMDNFKCEKKIYEEITEDMVFKVQVERPHIYCCPECSNPCWPFQCGNLPGPKNN